MRTLITAMTVAVLMGTPGKLTAQATRQRLAERVQDLSLTNEQETKIANIRGVPPQDPGGRQGAGGPCQRRVGEDPGCPHPRSEDQGRIAQGRTPGEPGGRPGRAARASGGNRPDRRRDCEDQGYPGGVPPQD